MRAMNNKEIVRSYLEALSFLLPQDACSSERDRTLRVVHQLRTAAASWEHLSVSENEQPIDAGLASTTCEAVVGMLRLLHRGCNHTRLEPNLTIKYTCAFLALACTVRTFEEAQCLPVPGQTAKIKGLESAVGLPLNGLVVNVVRFHPESGRFIVQFHPDDPPAAWKKVRVQSLAVETGHPGYCGALYAAAGARECGRACLESVSGIFDDLLWEMRAESMEDDQGDGLEKFLHSKLAVAMWEALCCCLENRGLGKNGLQLLELCDGDLALCSHFARNVFTAHEFSMASLAAIFANDEEASRQLPRLRGIQENFAVAYSGLFQPTAIWSVDNIPGERPIVDLQGDLDAHVRNVAGASVNFCVLEELAHAAKYHIAADLTVNSRTSFPLLLPVSLSRILCTVVAASLTLKDIDSMVIQRHVRLISLDVLAVFLAFTLAFARRSILGDCVNFLTASHAVLDALVALTTNGLWTTSAETTTTASAVVRSFLEIESVTSDPALLARLALALNPLPHDPALHAAYEALQPAAVDLFWQHVAARARLRNFSPVEAVDAVQNWLQVSFVIPLGTELRQATSSESAVNELIDRCLGELPNSLRELPPACVINPSELKDSSLSAEFGNVPEKPELSLLGLPAIPGQTPKDGETHSGPSSPTGNRHRRRISREEVARVRGVDAALAPDSLRCAIDGRLLGSPVRSPHGHIFEEKTLKLWIERCGSVCPVTNLPLRIDDCVRDTQVEEDVLQWVKCAKTQHKQQVLARRNLKSQGSLAEMETFDLS